MRRLRHSPIVALAAAIVPALAAAGPVAVSVGDRPLPAAALLERGRVFLPMRATFESLGAGVVYDPRSRTIVARSLLHALRLRIGAHEAIVDGRRVRLDAPARIIAAQAYVPLRFAAQALGAVVAYDPAAQRVSIGFRPGSVSLPAAGTQARVSGLDPPAGAAVSTGYPTIAASISGGSAARSDVRLSVDGSDVTALATFDGATITFVPRIGLMRGHHTVSFSGRTLQGANFSTDWSFDTSVSAPPESNAPAFYGYQFYTMGNSMYYAGDWMQFTLIAPPGGSAVLQLCDLGYQYAFWNGGYGTAYQANVPVPYGIWLPSCTVRAIYTSWTGRRVYIPIPVVVGIFTGAPLRPAIGRHTEPIGRRTEPHRKPEPPAPIVAATPHPVPSLRPMPTARPMPSLRPVPTSHPRIFATPVPR